MAPVRISYGGNVRRVRAGGQPVENLRPYRPPLGSAIRGIGRARLSGNHQHQTRAHRLCLPKPALKPPMRGIERVAMQVQGEIGHQRPALQPAVPVRIETRFR